MGFDQGEIIVNSPTGAYFAGQYVDGRLVFELEKVEKLRGINFTVKGFCKVHWTSRHSYHRRSKVTNRLRYYTVNHDSYEEYITLNMYLVGSENAEHTLNPGKYEYPFKFELPATCPSSFEGSSGHVRYELRAVMDKPDDIAKEVFRDIRVLAPLDLNAINCKEPASFEFNQTYWCCCWPFGGSETVVKIPARGYCPGQVIPVEVSCRNRSSVEIDHISINIKKQVFYRAEPTTMSEENVLVEVKKGLLPPRSDHRWQLDLAVPDMELLNLDTCSLIDIKYTFNVTVSPSGCHEDDDDSCQIYFGTAPPESGTDLTKQANMYPPAYTPSPQPIINQPVPVNPSYSGPNPSYPGPNPSYPGPNPSYPGPNPSYPGPNPSYPGPNPSYPGLNPSYPGPNPSYPGPSPPYPISSPQKSAPYPIEDKPSLGMPERGSSPSVPLLPSGSVPYPIGPSIGRSSPFAGASAPHIATPTTDNERKEPFDDDQSNSPFNPAFMEGKKETTTTTTAAERHPLLGLKKETPEDK